MKELTVVLGEEGIRTLKSYFSALQDSLPTVADAVESAIAEYGEQALREFAPTNDIDGNEVGSVSIEQGRDGLRVVYSGSDVAYIEFGTGYIGQNNPYPDEIVLNGANWVYDVNEHGVNGWVYRRKGTGELAHSRGMKPEAPVLKAFKKTEKEVPIIVAKVIHEKLG